MPGHLIAARRDDQVIGISLYHHIAMGIGDRYRLVSFLITDQGLADGSTRPFVAGIEWYRG